MNTTLKSVLQVLVSLALGVFLIWLVFKDLTVENRENLRQSFQQANYGWIVLSTLIAILSHVLRAYRWRYPMEALSLHVDMKSRFAAVMVGYLANLALPRLGEVSRCVVITRYHGHPFEKVFGTVMAERLVDAVCLLAIMAFSVLIQMDVLGLFLWERIQPMINGTNEIIMAALLLLAMAALGIVIWKFLARSSHPVALKARGKMHGFLAGFATLKSMPGMGMFYAYTIAIWASYIAMFFVGFHCLESLGDVPFGAKMAAFTLGGLSIVAVQGGLGAYPAAIMAILMLYGVDKEPGYAFGWIMWAAQTIMILVLGFLSMIVLPFFRTHADHAHR